MQAVSRALCTIGLALAATAALGAQAFPESAVKAAFLLRIAEYVEWPETPPGQFVIAVVGRDGMAESLRDLTNRPLHGRPVSVRQVGSLAEARDAHIIYVAGGRQADLRALQRAAPLKGVLVISDEEDGLARGGVINFRKVGGRIRFEVSLQASREADLKISADLLSVAVQVIH